MPKYLTLQIQCKILKSVQGNYFASKYILQIDLEIITVYCCFPLLTASTLLTLYSKNQRIELIYLNCLCIFYGGYRYQITFLLLSDIMYNTSVPHALIDGDVSCASLDYQRLSVCITIVTAINTRTST